VFHTGRIQYRYDPAGVQSIDRPVYLTKAPTAVVMQMFRYWQLYYPCYGNIQRFFTSKFYVSTVPTMYYYCFVTMSLVSGCFAVAWVTNQSSLRFTTTSFDGAMSLQRTHPKIQIQKDLYKYVFRYISDVIQTSSRTTRCNPVSGHMNDEILSDRRATPTNQLFAYSNLNNDIQYELMSIPDRGKLSTHAIYGTLLKESCIERYDVYRLMRRPLVSVLTTTTDALPLPDIVAVVTIGNELDGHNRVVHGGVLALIIDDVLGFGYFATLLQEYELRLVSNNCNNNATINRFDPDVVAVTANLNINYRAPVPAGTTCIVEATLVSSTNAEGRRIDTNKFHWNVELKSSDRSVTYCQATSLYVIPKRQ
jgi:acyl-coenzyme A thioesterase PaaI-like protein